MSQKDLHMAELDSPLYNGAVVYYEIKNENNLQHFYLPRTWIFSRICFLSLYGELLKLGLHLLPLLAFYDP